MIKQLESFLSAKQQANFKLKVFSLTKVPLLFLTGAKVVQIDSKKCLIQMPFNKINKNHLGSVYFGALAIGADACVGLLATDKIQQSGVKVSLIFKSFQAQFLKRAMGPTTFICEQGKEIDELLFRTLESHERQNKVISCYALCLDEKVAEFELELSLKKK